MSSRKDKWIKKIDSGKTIDSGSLNKEDLVDIVQALSSLDGTVTRRSFEERTDIPRSVIEKEFGTFTQLKSEAGLIPSRTERKMLNSIAKHSSLDKIRSISEERKSWGARYLKPNNNRYKTCLMFTDIHDEMCDAFALRVMLDTIKRIDSLDNIIIGGDLFDIPEFGKYFVDPRTWDASGKIKFVHEKILKPLRKAAPDVQIDLIEGNHEARLLNHVCDNSPALMDILSSVHGMKLEDIFGLDKFQINYVAKSDLTAWTPADTRKEVSKNYKIYHDSFIISHFPSARMKSGMPGAHGHHHKYQAWPMFNQTFGSYTWHQLGGFHIADASYADGTPWNTGMMLIHVDTKTNQTNWEYVNISDFAVVGGKYYEREKGEFLIK